MSTGWIRIAVLAAALVTFAAPTPAEWSGTGELGLVVARGNSDTESFNGRLQLGYTRERWTNETTLQFLRSEDSGEATASRYELGNKTDYALDERSYILGALRYDRDRFSNFAHQASAAVGYGYKLIDAERHLLKTELGPGVRYTEERDTGDTETELILRGFGEYRWNISETAEFVNRLLVESGSDNTFLENMAGIEVAINSRLALKTGFSARHNTRVEADRKKTDYLTTANLVYNY